jgi:hypothetical protein
MRGYAPNHQRHCEARSDEAIQLFLCSPWIASLALAMTMLEQVISNNRDDEAVSITPRSIPRDDLAFALMNIRWIERIAAAPPYQKLRAPGADRAVAAAPGGGLAHFVFRQLRKREDLAPHPPGGRDLFAVGTDAERDRQGRIAMGENEHLGIVDAAQRHAEKIADADIDRHLHAGNGTAQDHAFAVKFDLPYAAVRAGVVRVEADG